MKSGYQKRKERQQKAEREKKGRQLVTQFFQKKVKLDAATEVIAENLGKYWRKLGRKLGLTDVKLESISRRHPTDLEETTVELLKEWKKSRGAEARAEELIMALRACQYNNTADKVESKIADL